MLHRVKSDRPSSPETVALIALTTAFRLACPSEVPQQKRADEVVRKNLALIIVRHVDEGERDITRLASVALHELNESSPG